MSYKSNDGYVYVRPGHPRMKPFDLVDMMFVCSHLPVDYKPSP